MIKEQVMQYKGEGTPINSVPLQGQCVAYEVSLITLQPFDHLYIFFSSVELMSGTGRWSLFLNSVVVLWLSLVVLILHVCFLLKHINAVHFSVISLSI